LWENTKGQRMQIRCPFTFPNILIVTTAAFLFVTPVAFSFDNFCRERLTICHRCGSGIGA
jgi:hypothetical protein